MKKQQVKTRVKTSIAVGVTLLAVAGVAAAAAIAMAVLPAKLSVSVSKAVTSATYSKGSEATMLGINLTAGSGIVIVEQLSFDVLADSDSSFLTVENDVLASDHISSCSLQDKTGSLVGGPEAVMADGTLTFEDLALLVKKNKTVFYKIVCDLANVETTGGDGDIYALTIVDESGVVASNIKGDLLSGVTLDVGGKADSGINSNGGLVAVTVKNNGQLEVSLDSSSPISNIILGRSTDVLVGNWRFTASDEAFEINKMTLVNSGDDLVANAIKISCTDSSGTTVVNTGYLSSGSVLFSGLDCYVPKNSYSKISLSIETNDVSLTGVASGSLFQLSFVDTDFEAVGLNSGVTIGEGDLSTSKIEASEMVIYETRPTFSLSSSSPSGSGIPGRSEVLRFDVAADSRGDVTIHELTFKFNSTDIVGGGWNNCTTDFLSKFELYDNADLSTSLNLSLGGGLGYLVDGTSCTASLSEGVEEPLVYWQIGEPTSKGPIEIAAGFTKTFVLYFDSTGVSSDEDDSIRVDLSSQDEMDKFGLYAISWRGGTSDWANGTYIKSLPIYGGTITY